MTRILLVRHGATEWNLAKRAQGQADIGLTDVGRKQALRLVDVLREYKIDAIYSSDLSRAVDTAKPLAESRGLEIEVDRDLREIDQGEWTGLTTDEIRARWPDRWGPARHYNARPGGESPNDVRKRGLTAMRRIVEKHPNGCIVLVSHGGTIRWIVAESMGYNDRSSAQLRGLANGGALVLDGRVDGRLHLRFVERLDGRTPDLDDPNQ
jgi:glucosyl-3-phosphoglycerate phosphatase